MESLKKHGILLDAESFSSEKTECSVQNLNNVPKQDNTK